MSTVTKETFWTQIVEDPTLYGTITTEDNLFNYRSDAVWQVMNETFIANGGVFEVTKWEEMLGLASEETSLNNRKANILNHITENLPITIGILEQLIKETTDNNYEMIFDKQTSSLIIECFERDYNSIVSFIPRVIPTNLDVEYVFNDNELPFGYLRAEFLENTETQYIITDYYQSSSTGVEISADCNMRGRGGVTVCACGLVPTANGSPWAFGMRSNGLAIFSPFSNKYLYNGSIQVLNKRCLFNLKGNSLWIDGVEDSRSMYGAWSSTYAWNTARPLTLFCAPHSDNGNSPGYPTMKAYRFIVSVRGEVERDFIPVLDSTGTPCMFDLGSKQTFRNAGTGQFIAGFTLAQARKLGRLSESGGAMKISLPTGYDTDAEATNALEAARSKGWTLTIQTYEDASTTSTYSMRRIWVRKTEDENGNYVDSDGNRFIIEWCVDILSPENKSPENYGYESFRNKESAIEYWGLTEWIDPEIEKITEEQN